MKCRFFKKATKSDQARYRKALGIPPPDCSWAIDGDCPLGDDQYACRHGWLPCWTPSERAGLKAMGFEVGKESDDYQPEREAVIDAITAYVSASRRVKEGK